MFKLMFVFLTIATMFSSQSVSNPQKLKEEIMFSAYNNGFQVEMTEEDLTKFDKMFSDTIKGCRPMPAYGVSLHNETMKAVQEGVWIRFEFDECMEINGLPFDELLINLTKDMYGFNVIRGNDGVYDGRCFYIDVPRCMDEIYEYVKGLPVSEEKFELRQPLKCQDCIVEEELKIKEVSSEVEDCQDECCEGNCQKKGCQNPTSAELPSINKDNKEKPTTVIEQKGDVETTLLEALEF